MYHDHRSVTVCTPDTRDISVMAFSTVRELITDIRDMSLIALSTVRDLITDIRDMSVVVFFHC